MVMVAGMIKVATVSFAAFNEKDNKRHVTVYSFEVNEHYILS